MIFISRFADAALRNGIAAEKEMASSRQVLKCAAEFPLLNGFTFHEAMTFEFDCQELWYFALECTNSRIY